ncbi:hypothetical protein DFS34DRAFT_594908 [Phlyctochytrium arcticum]|nr:hypothetical protein DFS34DRAFT_594908 [Phlyctochytrium arcticum]
MPPDFRMSTQGMLPNGGTGGFIKGPVPGGTAPGPNFHQAFPGYGGMQPMQGSVPNPSTYAMSMASMPQNMMYASFPQQQMMHHAQAGMSVPQPMPGQVTSQQLAQQQHNQKQLAHSQLAQQQLAQQQNFAQQQQMVQHQQQLAQQQMLMQQQVRPHALPHQMGPGQHSLGAANSQFQHQQYAQMQGMGGGPMSAPMNAIRTPAIPQPNEMSVQHPGFVSPSASMASAMPRPSNPSSVASSSPIPRPARDPGTATQFTHSTIESILKINQHLIKILLDYQNNGWTNEPDYKPYQERLQTNLTYLATVADWVLKAPQRAAVGQSPPSLPNMSPVIYPERLQQAKPSHPI